MTAFERLKKWYESAAAVVVRRARVYAPGLAGRLALATGLLVALAVAAMSIFAIGALRRLADAEGLTRVELAVSSAREGMRLSTEDLLTVARTLGERPALQRQLRGPVPETLQPFLARYCESVALDACALVRGDELLAATPGPIDWDLVLASANEQGERFLITGAAPKMALSGARAGVEEHPGVTVIALRNLDERLAARLTERTGVPIAIVDYASFEPGEGPLAILNTDALSRGGTVAAYIGAIGSYAASLPVASTSGETIALLEARLPVEQVMVPASSMTRRIIFVAVLIAALAIATSVWLGYYWRRASGSATTGSVPSKASRMPPSGSVPAISPRRSRSAAAKSSRCSGPRWSECGAI
jgi:hypothetical protein